MVLALNAVRAEGDAHQMNIYVSTDMEGAAGVTHPAQCRPNHADYGRFRRILTYEVNAAVEAAVAGGATRVLVNDAHLTMTNLLLEELHPAAELISGSNKLLGQMEGIDATFDGVFFVGYHEGDGQGDGIINHTLMSGALRRVRVNGEEVDEAGLNARIAGAFGVPVLLLTGDDRVCATARAAFPGVETAVVKRAIDRLSGQHLPVTAARDLIRERAAAAMARLATDPPSPVVVDGPVRLEIEFRSSSAAQFCLVFPGTERTTPTTIAVEHEDFVAAYRHFWGLAALGLTAQDGLFGRGY